MIAAAAAVVVRERGPSHSFGLLIAVSFSLTHSSPSTMKEGGSESDREGRREAPKRIDNVLVLLLASIF